MVHFINEEINSGRTPYFAVVELDENDHISNQKTVPKVGEHFGGSGRRADFSKTQTKRDHHLWNGAERFEHLYAST